MMMYKREKTYQAFSLVEMLITMAIIGIVMVTSALVLTTLIKVSTVTTNKTRVRTESEYIQEILRRTIRTTDPNNVNLYNTLERMYKPETSQVSGPEPGMYAPISVNSKGNEIHLRPFGSNKWTCIGFFLTGKMEEKDNDVPEGYILKTSMSEDKYAPEKCFDNEFNKSFNYIVINSRFVNVSKLEMMYTESEDGNKEFLVDLYADALYWYFSKGAPLNRQIVRQTIVKTEAVKW